MVDANELVIITADGQSIKVTEHCLVRFMLRSGQKNMDKALVKIGRMLDERKEARMKKTNNCVNQIIKHGFRTARYYLDTTRRWVLVIEEGNILRTIYEDCGNRYVFK